MTPVKKFWISAGCFDSIMLVALFPFVLTSSDDIAFAITVVIIPMVIVNLALLTMLTNPRDWRPQPAVRPGGPNRVYEQAVRGGGVPYLPDELDRQVQDQINRVYGGPVAVPELVDGVLPPLDDQAPAVPPAPAPGVHTHGRVLPDLDQN